MSYRGQFIAAWPLRKRNLMSKHEELIKATFKVVHSGLRTYNNAEVKQIVYPLIEALREETSTTVVLSDLLSPEALEHWNWSEEFRARHGDRGCVCYLCTSVPRIIALLPECECVECSPMQYVPQDEAMKIATQIAEKTSDLLNRLADADSKIKRLGSAD